MRILISLFAGLFALSSLCFAQEGDSRADFAFNLFRRAAAREGNAALSPLSARIALAMAYAGARGETAKEMARVLRLPADPTAAAKEIAALLSEISAADGGDTVLKAADSLWAQNDLALEPGFVSLLHDDFAAEMHPADFMNALATSKAIDDWVAKHTAGKIQNLISPDAIKPGLRLVLVNALYLSAKWAEPFSKSATKNEPFQPATGNPFAVPMMHETLTTGYYESKDLQAVQLSYRGGKLAMLVLLPRTKGGLPALEKSLDGKSLGKVFEFLDRTRVQVSMPRFRVTETSDLAGSLGAMGMPIAFSQDADFSGISKSTPLMISKVLQKCFVAVDEAGTEAAAATAVTVGIGAYVPAPQKPFVFRADHPFLYLVRDTKTGTILFLGRVCDPR